MIVGRGDIATAIQDVGLDRTDRLYFAAGVSNSAEAREQAFLREFLLLERQPREPRLVYFSSLCVFYSDTRYACHKRWMEGRVRALFPRYCIVRLGNITWGDNPHTLINHLRLQQRLGLPLEVRPVYRYLCDLAEFRHWLALIPDWNCEFNVTGRRLLVRDIVAEFVMGQPVEVRQAI